MGWRAEISAPPLRRVAKKTLPPHHVKNGKISDFIHTFFSHLHPTPTFYFANPSPLPYTIKNGTKVVVVVVGVVVITSLC